MNFNNILPYVIISITISMVSIISVLIIKKRIEDKMGIQFKSQMQRHYEEVKSIYTTMRGWRHDYHNHIQTMKAHIALDQFDQLEGYLDELDNDLEKVDTQIKTGNIMADAIINSKAALAENNKIKINVKANVDKKIMVTDIDLCVIIGNLMDNAIDACLLIDDEDERFIRVYIGKLKEQMYISVSNATCETKRNSSNIFVSKKGGMMHGHGLKRVDTAVKKYEGYLNRQNEPGVFVTEILLPL